MGDIRPRRVRVVRVGSGAVRERVMQIERAKVVRLFEALGVTKAKDWSNDKLTLKVADKFAKELPKDVEKALPADDYNTYVDVGTALDKGATVKVVGGGEAPANKKSQGQTNVKPKAPTPAEKPKATKTSPAGKAVGAKPQGGKKAGGGGPKPAAHHAGVTRFIVDTLLAAKPNKGVTKKEVLARAVEKFKDRAEGSMWNTISSQIPNRIESQGIKVHKNAEAKTFWATEAKASANGSAAKKPAKAKAGN